MDHARSKQALLARALQRIIALAFRGAAGYALLMLDASLISNLATRLPKWAEPGCLMSPSGRIVWSFLDDLEVGEYLDMVDPSARTNAYVMANRKGIKISITHLLNGDFRIVRIL